MQKVLHHGSVCNYPHPSGSIPGTPFSEKWGELPIHVKERGSSSDLFLQTVATFPSPSDPGFPAYLTSGNTALIRPGPRRLKRRMSFFRLYVLCPSELPTCLDLQVMHKLWYQRRPGISTTVQRATRYDSAPVHTPVAGPMQSVPVFS
jgi:hypothetical protein